MTAVTKKGAISQQERVQIYALYESGMPESEIAQKMQRREASIQAVLARRETVVEDNKGTVSYKEFEILLGRAMSVRVRLPLGLTASENSIIVDQVQHILDQHRIQETPQPAWRPV